MKSSMISKANPTRAFASSKRVRDEIFHDFKGHPDPRFCFQQKGTG
jgi:hypothetical protein